MMMFLVRFLSSSAHCAWESLSLSHSLFSILSYGVALCEAGEKGGGRNAGGSAKEVEMARGGTRRRRRLFSSFLHRQWRLARLSHEKLSHPKRVVGRRGKLKIHGVSHDMNKAHTRYYYILLLTRYTKVRLKPPRAFKDAVG